MNCKISIIGAGSAVFSVRMIRDLCLTPGLSGSTVSLMDIDPQRLRGVHELCRRYAAEVGADLKIESTTDRDESLAGADFVIITALAAGHDRLQAGWKVASGHGYRFGGSLHVMHDEAFWINFYQLKLFESLIEDILLIAPAAWIQLVANPVFAGISHLKRKYPTARLMGLCHGFSGVFRLAELLGLDAAGLTYEIPGVNHFVWLTHLSHNGQDMFPRLEEWIAESSETYWKSSGLSDPHGPKAIDLYRRFGVFPIGDTGTPGGGSWGWWYHADDATEHRWQEDPAGWYDRYVVGGKARVAEINQLAEDPTARVTDLFPAQMSGETMVPIIESIACDLPRVFIVNVLNDGGYVPGIPADCSVEIPALVSARGIQGIRTNPLPTELVAHARRDYVALAEIELDAFVRGSRESLLQLLLSDPWTRSESQANALLDDILNLDFNAQMKAHYR